MTLQAFSFPWKPWKHIVGSTIWERKQGDWQEPCTFNYLDSHHSNSSERLMQSEPSPKHASFNFLMLPSHSGLSDSCESIYIKNPGLTCPSNIPRVLFKPKTFESVMLCSHLTLCHSLLLHPTFPGISFLPVILLLASGGRYIGSSCAASVLLRIGRNDSLHGLQVWTPCSPRNSHTSSLALLL